MTTTDSGAGDLDAGDLGAGDLDAGDLDAAHLQTGEVDAPKDPLRWKALAVLLLVQFILILDVTVVNIALPTIQSSLHFSRAGLAWVVDGYVLTAGGLLLLGGRLGDLFGRRRLFIVGLLVFGVASLTSGLAQNPGMLVASRFVQGGGEALTAPAAFSLITLLFTDKQERTKAIGFFGGVAGVAGTLGSVLSGVIVEYTSWRLIFLINIPIVVFALVMVPRLVKESRADTTRSSAAARPDYLGGLLSTAGLTGVVFGFIQAATHPWGNARVLLPLVVGLGLLIAFVLAERVSADPLVPLSFFTNRTRVSANAATVFFYSVFFTQFFLITLYLQNVRHFSALEAGLSYLPFGAATGIAVGMATGLQRKIGTKPILIAGFVLSAIGLLLYARITTTGSYPDQVLPGMVVVAFGSGLCLPTLTTAAVHEVTGQDAGLASGVQQAIQQVGGAVGLAVLLTIALRHAAGAAQGVSPAQAITSGYVLALRVAAAVFVAGALLVATVLENDKGDANAPA